MGRGYISYEEQKRDECLVKLAQRVGGWVAASGRLELQLFPDEFTRAVSPRLRDKNLACSYQVLRAEDDIPGNPVATIIPVGQGLAIRVRNVSKGSMIRVQVACGRDFWWESSYQPVDARILHLRTGDAP